MAARKLNRYIFLSIVGCILSIIICCISLGTQNWYNGITKIKRNDTNNNDDGADDTTSTITKINHGLFQGNKIKLLVNQQKKYPLFVVCSVNDGFCMFSCGEDNEKRQLDIKRILDGQVYQDVNLCKDGEVITNDDTFKRINEDPDESNDRPFLSFPLWLTTLIFIGIAILFSLIGALLGLYNSFSAPFQPLLSVFGLYIWNGVAAVCIILTMIVWGIAFATNLNKSAAVSETLSGVQSSNGEGSLGVSYWILLVAEFLNLGNIAMLRYRTWKILDAEKNNVIVMDPKLTHGEILLF